MSSYNLNLEENNRVIILYDEPSDRVQTLEEFCSSKTLTKTIQESVDNMERNGY